MLSPDTADRPTTLPLLAAAEVQDDLLAARHDLERLHRLLGDASEALIGHFRAASDQLRQALQTLGRQPGTDALPLQRAMEHVAGAVTAMQFQDLASQLIGHTSQRLRGCADRLARGAMGDDEDGEAVVDAPPKGPNPVTQDELDAGSIELF